MSEPQRDRIVEELIRRASEGCEGPLDDGCWQNKLPMHLWCDPCRCQEAAKLLRASVAPAPQEAELKLCTAVHYQAIGICGLPVGHEGRHRSGSEEFDQLTASLTAEAPAAAQEEQKLHPDSTVARFFRDSEPAVRATVCANRHVSEQATDNHEWSLARVSALEEVVRENKQRADEAKFDLEEVKERAIRNLADLIKQREEDQATIATLTSALKEIAGVVYNRIDAEGGDLNEHVAIAARAIASRQTEIARWPQTATASAGTAPQEEQ